MSLRVACARTVITVLVLAGVLALAAARCGSRPGSPEELYEKVARLNAEGRTGAIWDLLVEEKRAEFRKAIDDMRDVIRRNPGALKPRTPGAARLTDQFNVTPEEFMILPYDEIFRRENLGRERALLDSRIVDRARDPRPPYDTVLTIQTSGKERVLMRCRLANGGWGLVEMAVLP